MRYSTVPVPHNVFPNGGRRATGSYKGSYNVHGVVPVPSTVRERRARLRTLEHACSCCSRVTGDQGRLLKEVTD